MLTWSLLDASFVGTKKWVHNTGSYPVSFCVVEQPQERPVEFRSLERRGGVAGLDWKGCEHVQTDGHLLLGVSRSDVIFSEDVFAAPPVVGRTVVQGGYFGVDSSTTIYSPVGSRTTALRWASATRCYALIVESRWQSGTSNVLTGSALCRADFTYDSTVKRNRWRYNTSSYSGLLRSGISRSDSLEEVIGTWTWNPAKVVNRGRLNIAYANYSSLGYMPSDSQVLCLLQHEFARIRTRARQELRRSEESLHATSFDSIQKFDGNMLLFLSKFSSIGRSTISSLIDWSTSGMGLKDAASLWLSSRFGDRLAYKGLKQLVSSINKQFLAVGYHTSRYVIGSARLPLSVDESGIRMRGYMASRLALRPNDSNAIMRSIRTAYEWDIYPSLGNTWDAIPLSFVVDWFVNVGDVYASIDRLVQARYYNLIAALNTVKVEATSERLPGVVFTYYSRGISHDLRLSVSSVQLGLPSLVHWLDGTALFVGMSS